MTHHPVTQNGCLAGPKSTPRWPVSASGLSLCLRQCSAQCSRFHQHCHSTKTSGYYRPRMLSPPSQRLPQTKLQVASSLLLLFLFLSQNEYYWYAKGRPGPETIRSGQLCPPSLASNTCLTTRAPTPPDSTSPQPTTPSRCHVMPSPTPHSNQQPCNAHGPPARRPHQKAPGPAPIALGASFVVIQLSPHLVPQRVHPIVTIMVTDLPTPSTSEWLQTPSRGMWNRLPN